MVLRLDDVAVGRLFGGSSIAMIANQIENVRALLRVEVEVAEQILHIARREGRSRGADRLLPAADDGPRQRDEASGAQGPATRSRNRRPPSIPNLIDLSGPRPLNS